MTTKTDSNGRKYLATFITIIIFLVGIIVNMYFRSDSNAEASVDLKIKPVAEHVKAVEAKAERNTNVNDKQDEQISALSTKVAVNDNRFQTIIELLTELKAEVKKNDKVNKNP